MDTTEYAIAPISDAAREAGNLFAGYRTTVKASPKVRKIQRVNVETSDADRLRVYDGYIAAHFTPEQAYRATNESLARRTERTDWTLLELDTQDRPDARGFQAAYGQPKAYRANHRVQAADCQEAYARVIHRRTR